VARHADGGGQRRRADRALAGENVQPLAAGRTHAESGATEPVAAANPFIQLGVQAPSQTSSWRGYSVTHPPGRTPLRPRPQASYDRLLPTSSNPAVFRLMCGSDWRRWCTQCQRNSYRALGIALPTMPGCAISAYLASRSHRKRGFAARSPCRLRPTSVRLPNRRLARTRARCGSPAHANWRWQWRRS